jgi:ribose transport system permease protein
VLSSSLGGVTMALALMVAVVSAFHPEFLSRDSLVNVGQQAALYGIMALGMVFLLAMRDVDLSVGSSYALSIVCCALLMEAGVPPWVAGALGVLVGVSCGIANALLSNVLNVSTIIVTLGTLSLFRGLVLILTDQRYITDLPSGSSFFRVLGGDVLGVPMSVIALLSLTVAVTAVFTRSRFGYTVRAIGSNPEAARLSGISIGLTRLKALALMGLLAGVSGILTFAYFQTADPSLGTGYELYVIAGAVIGGTGLAGGSGSVPGALIGALILAVITSGLVQFQISANWSTFVTGAVILGAVSVDAVVRRRNRTTT